ncbi:FAD-dependent oxidoreductase [Roseateles asaccharophilus]|uniref:Protoporphyrinogen oxidase n=1 Tax=Roseateles asaccharophilus TaxID=582607 RepID=A0ABU2A337_9BURK|nr:FAD-dependent oxidoreductase [Roseateles asaccharophilus]MDR7331604.1 protoporphyrinogen oxidase [Roseateles asaccharophilus]
MRPPLSLPSPRLSRRALLLGALSAGCTPEKPPLQGGWVGTHPERGHRLRGELPKADGPIKKTGVLIVGAGIGGLACARALRQRGVDDFALLDLEDQAGGNSRSHTLNGLPCPLGAHYLPVPGEHAREVAELLHDLGVARQHLGRTVWDERHLCHSPQERLFFDGAWHEGLLPPADDAPATREQYRRFAALVAQAQRELGFAMPTRRAHWTPGHAALDAQTFAAWLDRAGLNDERLRWYLDYCCRDDFGANADGVSAWAGLHYFASRHGFHAPGDDTAEREPVLTWPQGNGWLSERIAQPLRDRLHVGRSVLRVTEGREGIEALAWNEAANAPERWSARAVVMATPLFIAARLLATPPDALRALRLSYAPWLTANVLLREPLLHRVGAPAAWDSVRYGTTALGYVDARHQSLDPTPQPPLLTAYFALPAAQRAALLSQPWQHWAKVVTDELAQTHPDLSAKVERMDLCRFGHAMSIPTPGLRSSAALAALNESTGRVVFVHSDLAGYSVFEEAYTAGIEAATRLNIDRKAQ